MQNFALSCFDVMDMNGVGGTGGAKGPAGYKDYLIAGLCPFVLNNELIDQTRELPDVLRDWPAGWYDSVMQAHLTA